MTGDIRKRLEQAVWVARTLFQRGRVTGNTGNISLRIGERIYVSASGSTFASLTEEQFGVTDLDGRILEGPKMSKEWPLHLAVYRARREVGAVIHTHSLYSVLWSCLEHENEADCIPDHTPYLRMKLGSVGLVPYEPPGSPALFRAFEQRLERSDGWLLCRHGAVVPGRDVMDAFFCLEELEESAHVAWELCKKCNILCRP